MPTLNNKLKRAQLSLIQLRDDFSRRSKELRTSFPSESEKLNREVNKIEQMLESIDSLQAGCNLGDRFEIFNK